MKLLRKAIATISLIIIILWILFVPKKKGEYQNSETKFFYLPNDTHCPIAHFEEKELSIKSAVDLCSYLSTDWIDVINNYAIFNKSVAENIGEISCAYRTIVRNTDFKSDFSHPWAMFYNNTFLGSHILLVHCKAPSLFSYKEQYLLGFDDKRNMREGNSAADILVMGIDSVSRSAWRRLLKESHHYLENSMNESTVIFKKMNVLGDGTTVNILGILAGELETEVYESRRGYQEAKPVDDYPWIWQLLKSRNYLTYHDEDDILYGTFQYRLLGFHRQPTDFYSRTWRLIRDEKKVSTLCYNHRNMFEDQFNNVRSFFGNVKSPKFGFVWSTYFSHNLNEDVVDLDKSLTKMLEEINNENSVFNNTILILMSDHGHRFDSRLHLQGKFEERLPFFSIHLPKTLVRKRPEILKGLKANENKLITGLDAYESLRDIVNNYTFSVNNETVRHKMSLFNGEIPFRSCSSVKVATHWCSCLKWTTVSVDNDVVRQAATHMVNVINTNTAEYRSMCQRLELDRVIRAHLIAPSDEVLRFHSSDGHGRVPNMWDQTKVDSVYYRINLQTKPGDALFESTVSVKVTKNGEITFGCDIRNIDRNNRFKDWIWCIKDGMKDVRKYCLCK